MKKLLISSIILVGLLAAGCNLGQKPAPTPTATQPTPQPTPANETNVNESQPGTNEISLLISTADVLKYCNGADMDSEGYKKTLTKEIKFMNFENGLSQTQLMRKSLIWVGEQSGISFPQADNEDYIKIVGDTAYIQPIGGWAGVSIALCGWQPLVEVNAVRFPGIKKVEWVTDQTQWDNL